jgi:ABC-type uncharacterized transport system involved in gliding motility auxiliary subunit
MQRKMNAIVALVVVAVIVLAVNLIGSLLLNRVKLDITEERLYTLSEGSRNTLKTIDAPVTARFFFSRTALASVPFLRDYANRIVELLREYQAYSGGKLTLEIVDPRPDTAEEEIAEKAGIQGVPISEETGTVYLGLVIRDEGGEEVAIPFFDPRRESSIEYEITKALYTVTHPEKKKVGVLSSLPVMGGAAPQNPMMQRQQQQDRPWVFVNQLRQMNFEVTKIEESAKEIPSDLKLLLIVHPKNLSETLQYAIDQYVMAGGKVVAFVDPLCESDKRAMSQMGQMNPQAMMQMSLSSDMPKLLKSWGVELVSGEGAPAGGMMGMPGGASGPSPKVVADPGMSLKVPSRTGEVRNMISWLELKEPNIAKSEILTDGLSSIFCISAGSLQKASQTEGIEAEPLLETSEAGRTLDGTMMKFMGDPEQIQSDYQASTQAKAKQVLAYKLTGKFKSAFPDGKPADEPAKDAESDTPKPPTPPADPNKKSLKECEKETTVIVVADADMLANEFSVQVQNVMGMELLNPMNQNLNFVLNVTEVLSGSQDLISLRSRGTSQRPFTKVAEIQKTAQEKWMAEEQSLKKQLEEVEARWQQLQSGTKDQKLLSAQLAKEKNNVSQSRAETRQKLREVRRNLRENVERLGTRLEFINIALMPLVVVVFSLALAFIRSSRRSKAMQNANRSDR